MKIFKSLKSLFLITALGTIVMNSSCKKDDEPVIPPPVVTPTVVGIAQSNPDFSILVSAVTKAGLVATLSDVTKKFTVFAPTNAAFIAAGYPQSVIDGLTPAQVTSVLTPILTYHVVGAEVLAANVPASDTVRTLNGRNLFASSNANGVFLNGVRVVTPNLSASNGVVHVIGRVLIPPTESIAQVVIRNATATPPQFTLLLAAVSRAGLAGVLSGPGKFTVFAPVDAAFIALGAPYTTPASIAAIPTSDSAALRRILLSHVIGTNVFAGDLIIGGTANTLNTPATLTIGGSAVAPSIRITTSAAANAANINGTLNNITAINGVIHVIDKVLL